MIFADLLLDFSTGLARELPSKDKKVQRYSNESRSNSKHINKAS